MILAQHPPRPAHERQLSHAFALTGSYPAAVEALDTGAISLAHSKVIVDAGQIIGSGDTVGSLTRRSAYETEVLELANALTPAQLRPQARRLAEQYAESSIEERYEAAQQRRRVWVEDQPDGMADVLTELLLGGLTSGSGANRVGQVEIHGRVQVITHERTLFPRDSADSDPTASDLATSNSAEADFSADSAACAPHEVQPAEIQSYGSIPTASAARLAASASHWTEFKTDALTGEALSVNRYRPSEQMRRLLTVRDECCRFPGCTVPVRRCDLDHTIDAQYGGPTATDNLAYLCRNHHRLKHHTGWRVVQPPKGVLEWRTPTGRTAKVRPPSSVRFIPLDDCLRKHAWGWHIPDPPAEDFARNDPHPEAEQRLPF